MKRFLGPAVLVVALTVAAFGVGTANATLVTFVGTYAGHVTEVVNGTAVTATAKGTGKATLLGSGSMSGIVKATTANPPCTPLSGTGVLVSPKGKLKLLLLTGARACAAGEDQPNNISFAGYAKVTGGAGVYRYATGKLHFSGHYNRGTGAFNVKLTGTVKRP
jgi:hypothetical protein